MTGTGPFLWLMREGPPQGYRELPKGGLCLSTFLFLERDGKVLLGKYRPHAAWPELTGLDDAFQVACGHGWTIPASQLKFGEDPRATARRIAHDVLSLPEDAVTFTEPTVETDVGELPELPGLWHYDVLFFVNATLADGVEVTTPPWYADLSWHDPRTLDADAYARSHDEVVARWLDPSSRPPGEAVTEPPE